MEKVCEKEFLISRDNIDKFLNELERKNLPKKKEIIFILHEIFMNVLEHSLGNINTRK
jgi:hypothetical protein